MRKKEVEALIAGLEQQRHAARATRDHLQTTFAALRARYVDAERRLQGLPGSATSASASKQPIAASSTSDWTEIDNELAALRKQLDNPG
jgi:phage shock protein A